MTTEADHTDAITIGDGIAESTRSTTPAHKDMDVLLERDHSNQDRYKDETTMPRAWAEADRLGLTVVGQPVDALLE